MCCAIGNVSLSSNHTEAIQGSACTGSLEIERFTEIKSLIYDRGFTIAGARKVLEEQHGTQLNVDQIRLLVTQLQTIQLKLRSLQRELEQKSL